MRRRHPRHLRLLQVAGSPLLNRMLRQPQMKKRPIRKKRAKFLHLKIDEKEKLDVYIEKQTFVGIF